MSAQYNTRSDAQLMSRLIQRSQQLFRSLFRKKDGWLMNDAALRIYNLEKEVQWLRQRISHTDAALRPDPYAALMAERIKDEAWQQ